MKDQTNSTGQYGEDNGGEENGDNGDNEADGGTEDDVVEETTRRSDRNFNLFETQKD